MAKKKTVKQSDKFEVHIEGYTMPSILVEADDEKQAIKSAKTLITKDYPKAKVIKAVKK